MTEQDEILNSLVAGVAPVADPPAAPATVIPAIEENDFIEQLAERTAAKIAEGLLRLPPVIRASLARLAPGGFYLAPTSCGYGPDRFDFRAFARPTGIELAIYDSAGNRVWMAVLL